MECGRCAKQRQAAPIERVADGSVVVRAMHASEDLLVSIDSRVERVIRARKTIGVDSTPVRALPSGSMRIVDLMSEALVLAELRGSARDEVLGELVDHLVAHASVPLRRDITYERLIERERLASTAVGHGIAIPHAKLPDIDRAVACFGRSRVGVDFGSRDGAPTHLFLTILAPEGNAGLHLKALARASRLFMDTGFRSEMVAMEDASSLWDALAAHDARLSS